MKNKTLIWLFVIFYIPFLVLGSIFYVLSSLIKAFAYLLWFDVPSLRYEIESIKMIGSKFKY